MDDSAHLQWNLRQKEVLMSHGKRLTEKPAAVENMLERFWTRQGSPDSVTSKRLGAETSRSAATKERSVMIPPPARSSRSIASPPRKAPPSVVIPDESEEDDDEDEEAPLATLIGGERRSA